MVTRNQLKHNNLADCDKLEIIHKLYDRLGKLSEDFYKRYVVHNQSRLRQRISLRDMCRNWSLFHPWICLSRILLFKHQIFPSHNIFLSLSDKTPPVRTLIFHFHSDYQSQIDPLKNAHQNFREFSVPSKCLAILWKCINAI